MFAVHESLIDTFTRSSLLLTEKLLIAGTDPNVLLNKGDELV